MLQVHRGRPLQVGDFVGVEALPHPSRPMLDPFLVLHHVSTTLAPGTDASQAGVGPHPHRGFAPVSLIFEGAVHHRDSAGNDSIIRAGGTQWMAAGSGVIHSERPPVELARSGGTLDLIQLWVNSPARDKMLPPQYWGLEAADTPLVPAEPGVALGLVAGRYSEQAGPIPTQSALLLLRGTLAAGARFDWAVPQGWSVGVYVLRGAVQVGEARIDAQQLGSALDWSGAPLDITAEADARVVLMAGAPLAEPIAAYGPFVMNTEDEIRQAMRDYGNGRMGVLAE